MSALRFFTPPPYKSSHLPNGTTTHQTDFFLPQTIDGHLMVVRFSGPQSWLAFDVVRLTVSQNAVLEKVVHAGGEAGILNSLMNRISVCFLYSFDVMFPGQGLTTYCQHQAPFVHVADRVCDQLGSLSVNPVDAQYQLTLHWTKIHEKMTRDFEVLMSQCDRSVRKLKGMMQDPMLLEYARVNEIFRDWWAERAKEVTHLDDLLHDPEFIVPPTIRNALEEISRQIPSGERVQIITKLHCIYHTLAILTSDGTHLADDNQVLAEVERLSSGINVSALLERLTL